MDKYKIRLGYNTVPPPYTGNFMPLKLDLVYPSLDDFVDMNKSVSESVVEKLTVESNEPKTANKENRAPIIEDWVCKSKEDDEPKVNPQQDLKDKRVIDSGCSRHMIGNRSYLIDYKEIDREVVAFRGNSKGGKITGKCKIRTDFKLTDESHVLLKVPRKDNMYNVDLKNVIPQGGNPQQDLKDNGVIDSGCSRDMTGNRSYLIDYEAINGGFFAFGGNSKGGKVTGKGKFDRKADVGFFVGYSTNSKAFRVFNSRTKIMEENLHVKFSENTPNITGSKPNWLFDIDVLTKSMNYKPVVTGNQSNGSACTKRDDIISKTRVETVPDKDYILLPLWTEDLLFSSSLKDSSSAGYKPSGEEEKKDTEDPGNEDSEAPITEEPRVNQEKDNANSTNRVNAFSLTINATSNEVNAVDGCDECFFYGKIEEEVYVCQPLGFDDHDFPDKVYKVEKALSGLHQAPRACDYAGASLDRKSTTRGCQFLKCRLISWQCKKQTVVANSTTEANPLKVQDLSKLLTSEASIRRDLRFGDEGGIDCLTNETIFEQLSLMGAKTTAWNEFSSTIASAVICLAIDQKFNFSKYIFDSMTSSSQPSRKQKPRKTRRHDTELPQTSMPIDTVVDEAVNEEMYDSLKRATTAATRLDAEQDRGNISKTQSKATPNKPSSLGTSSDGGPRRQDTIRDTIAQTRSENVSNFSNDPPLSRFNILRSGEDRLKLKELMELCTKLFDRILNLETTKTAPAKEIANLKKRVKRLERKRKSRSYGLKILYKVELSARVESSADEESLGEEDASKQRRIFDIDANQGIYLVNGEEVDVDKEVAGKDVSVVEEVNAASIVTSIIGITLIISMDEITLAKALIEIKTSRPKAKGIVMQEISETPTPTPIVSFEQPSKVQDKGKEIMVEPEMPLKKKA
uniref:Ribonuclease H-like domain-containing protein n=1 Tax=Tanacetum cinerariifolium TaxID=118510 RepID=A0A6L2L0J8_TANCI|nr:ribonuclease H-like domain-containing protein [Tanacetum cinerariifolium]